MTTLQEELANLADRCQQLQTALDAAERRVAVLATGQFPSLHDLEGMLHRLAAQRDSAQAAAVQSQAVLPLRDAEVQQRKQDTGPLAGHIGLSIDVPPESPEGERQHGTGAAAPAGPVNVAAPLTTDNLKEALAAERQQTQQLQAALHALTIEMQRLTEEQAHERHRRQVALVVSGASLRSGTSALMDLTNKKEQSRRHHEHDVQRLVKQLARAQARMRQLAAENERLMEMSNGLRAERNRLARAQQDKGCGSGTDAALDICSLQLPTAPPPMIVLPTGMCPLLALPASAQHVQLPSNSREGSPTLTANSACNSDWQQRQQQQQQQLGLEEVAADGDRAPAEQLPIGVVGVQLQATRPAAAAGAPAPTGDSTKRQQPVKVSSPPRVRNYNVKSP